ncbi:hypothetical protein EYF80_023124 [Liparis tanakae]|uniref:Uncharacterized protein n=1 Tax=Liparis tanakae TaxID=230148 RepID=A0A4Z2HLZ2_9TELE|nr:hypothetical protein EYF80_023124 [Liparis tanakae]
MTYGVYAHRILFAVCVVGLTWYSCDVAMMTISKASPLEKGMSRILSSDPQDPPSQELKTTLSQPSKRGLKWRAMSLDSDSPQSRLRKNLPQGTHAGFSQRTLSRVGRRHLQSAASAWTTAADVRTSKNCSASDQVGRDIRCEMESWYVACKISVERRSKHRKAHVAQRHQRIGDDIDDDDEEEEGDVKDHSVELVFITGRVLNFISDATTGAHADVHVEQNLRKKLNATTVYRYTTTASNPTVIISCERRNISAPRAESPAVRRSRGTGADLFAVVRNGGQNGAQGFDPHGDVQKKSGEEEVVVVSEQRRQHVPAEIEEGLMKGEGDAVRCQRVKCDDATGLSRSVEHQSVPLALDVVILRLLSDVDTIKLQLSGQLLLSLEDNQRDLKGKGGTLLETHKRTQEPNTWFSLWCKHRVP